MTAPVLFQRNHNPEEDVIQNDLPAPCPRCKTNTLVVSRNLDDPLDLMPLCRNDGCTWIGAVSQHDQDCRACHTVIPSGTPAMFTQYIGKLRIILGMLFSCVYPFSLFPPSHTKIYCNIRFSPFRHAQVQTRPNVHPATHTYICPTAYLKPIQLDVSCVLGWQLHKKYVITIYVQHFPQTPISVSSATTTGTRYCFLCTYLLVFSTSLFRIFASSTPFLFNFRMAKNAAGMHLIHRPTKSSPNMTSSRQACLTEHPPATSPVR